MCRPPPRKNRSSRPRWRRFSPGIPRWAPSRGERCRSSYSRNPVRQPPVRRTRQLERVSLPSRARLALSSTARRSARAWTWSTDSRRPRSWRRVRRVRCRVAGPASWRPPFAPEQAWRACDRQSSILRPRRSPRDPRRPRSASWIPSKPWPTSPGRAPSPSARRPSRRSPQGIQWTRQSVRLCLMWHECIRSVRERHRMRAPAHCFLARFREVARPMLSRRAS
jgi:hypothetical protein